MSNPFGVKINQFKIKDISASISSFEATTQVGNTYQDLMGFGELWVITKIEYDEIYLVSITNQFRPTLVTGYDEGFLMMFARNSIYKEDLNGRNRIPIK